MESAWPWWLLLAADAVLQGAVAWLLWRLKPGRGGAAGPADLGRFMAEAGRLSQEFDRLLGEKRELVATTLRTLDQRIAQMQEMIQGLEERLAAPPAPPAPQAPPPEPDDSMREFRRRVRELARQGHSPQQIAEATGRPRGEVELALSLGRP